LVATDPKYLAKHQLTPADVRGVVGLSTPTDLAPRADKKGFGDALLAGRGADVFHRDPDVMRDASPVRHVSKGLPPFLLVVGDRDFPTLEGDARAFAAKAKAVGAPVEVYVAEGHDHMGVVRGLPKADDAVLARVLAFLKRAAE
jgi:acetyl esterase/lipase